MGPKLIWSKFFSLFIVKFKKLGISAPLISSCGHKVPNQFNNGHMEWIISGLILIKSNAAFKFKFYNIYRRFEYLNLVHHQFIKM